MPRDKHRAEIGEEMAMGGGGHWGQARAGVKENQAFRHPSKERLCEGGNPGEITQVHAA